MIEVLYEDNHILVANKPAGTPSQADKSGDMDMLSIVKEYVRSKYGKPGEAFIGLVHRLDRPAAGLMVFARTSKAARRLSEDVRLGRFKKTYLAVVYGDAPGGSMEDYLRKDPKTNISTVAEEGVPGAKHAALSYETLQTKNGRSLVKINLLTGRAHQIRVQFASRGLPLVGDIKYGSAVPDRLALYACSIGLTHPTKKEYMEFSSLPVDGAFFAFDLSDLQKDGKIFT